MLRDNGREFYDITNIKEAPRHAGQSEKSPADWKAESLSTESISQPEPVVNPHDESSGDDDLRFRYSVRTEPAPMKTVPVYKLMRYENGNLYPLYIDNSNPIEIGTWYNADSPKISDLENLDVGYAYKIDSNGNVIDTKPIKGQSR
jgi:hypothetical protein